MLIITDTQMRIIDAYLSIVKEQPDIHKITMQMIADKADITRQNIYKKHFSSVEDITNKIHDIIAHDCHQKLIDFVVNDGNDVVSYFAKIVLPLLYDKRDWLKVLYSCPADPSWSLFLIDQYRPIIQYQILKLGNNSNLADEFLCKLIAGQFLAVLYSWLTSEVPEPPSLFQKKFIKLLSPIYELTLIR